MTSIILVIVCCTEGVSIGRTEDYRRGEILGSIFIPKIALWKPIIFVPLEDKSYDLSDLWWRVGILEGTAQLEPGKRTPEGNTVLVGHTPGSFEDISELSHGDLIHLWTEDQVLTYMVTEIRLVMEDQVEVLDPTEEPTVTLITCIPKSADKRLIIVATYSKKGSSL